MGRILVATTRSWNIREFHRWSRQTTHTTCLVTSPDQLRSADIAQFNPDYVFFPHWSWRIKPELFATYECIAFHMSPLPFGRGGSPLQNLISRGIYETQVCAFRVVEKLDAGPVYLRRPLCLHGSASEIYIRTAQLVFSMIDLIVSEKPIPVDQEGDVVEFNRRTPDESAIPETGLSVQTLFDFIRMLDAEGYPGAYLVQSGFRYTFSRPALRDGSIVADVTIVPVEDDK